MCSTDLRLSGSLTEPDLVELRVAVFDFLGAMNAVDVSRTVLSRAGQPLPTASGSLDAIHLVTALIWRETTGDELVMATHDPALATASRALGLRVIGSDAR